MPSSWCRPASWASILWLALPAACDRSEPEPSPPPKAETSEPAADSTPKTPPSEEPASEEPEPIVPTTEHVFSARDLLAFDRVSDPQPSRDGKHIAFVRRVTDLKANEGRTDVWSVPVDGGEPVRLTNHSESDHSPRWSNDGQTLYFLSGRSGSSQVWTVPATGGGARQVTDLPLGVSNLVVSPDGRHLAFTIPVFIDCEDLACTQKRLEETEESPQTGQAYDELFVRHWDTWWDGRRSHLFVLPNDGSGEPVDVTRGLDASVPSEPFGGPDEIAWSPDGETLVFAAKDVGGARAWSTNYDLFSVSVKGGERTNLTEANPAWDTHPAFSPDGKTLVWTAMKRPGYESDRFGLMTMAWPPTDDAPAKEVAPDWDRSIGSLTFAPDGQSVVVSAQDIGQTSLFSIALEDGTVTELVDAGTNGSPAFAGDQLVYTHHDLEHPAEIHAIPAAGGEPRAITSVNETKLAAVKMGKAEQFSFTGAQGDTVYGYAVAPVDAKEGERYPIAFLIHGGPQGSFGNMFHYRWNPQVYAGAGYGVVMIDFHGSTGYGQSFTDAIRDDWGGKPLEDLQKGLAAAVERYPWLDSERACALGASYGGFMINWIAGNWPDRFDCLVNHDGVFEQRMMYYGTEELWFPEWEHLGPYFENPKGHEKHNPASFVERWKTPMLIVHGALDYRVPPTQGIAAFNALQRRGIESRFLYFPDENHWVLSPANSLQWHEVVLDWLDTHTKGQAEAPPDEALQD